MEFDYYDDHHKENGIVSISGNALIVKSKSTSTTVLISHITAIRKHVIDDQKVRFVIIAKGGGNYLIGFTIKKDSADLLESEIMEKI